MTGLETAATIYAAGAVAVVLMALAARWDDRRADARAVVAYAEALCRAAAADPYQLNTEED